MKLADIKTIQHGSFVLDRRITQPEKNTVHKTLIDINFEMFLGLTKIHTFDQCYVLCERGLK